MPKPADFFNLDFRLICSFIFVIHEWIGLCFPRVNSRRYAEALIGLIDVSVQPLPFTGSFRQLKDLTDWNMCRSISGDGLCIPLTHVLTMLAHSA